MLYILNVLSILLLIYGVYYVFLSFFGIKKLKYKEYKDVTKFKVLIACRNEEKVISNIIDSLKNQNYPKDLYEICVIPNNCTDKTEEIVRSLNTRIIECNRTTRCKADALRVAFAALEKEDFDAYVVFDADNIAHPNFLHKMNNMVCTGYEVAQGNRDSKNPEDSWISGSYAIYYWMQSLLLNRARANLKSSAFLNGTGYMVSKTIVEKYGFETKTLTEDIEFTAKCAINNIKIGYAEEAITYDEQPVDFKTSWKQRKRWSKGALRCLKLYYKDLIKGLFKHKNLLCIDMIFNFMSPLVQVFSAVIAVLMFALKIIAQIELAPLTLLYILRLSGIHFGIITYIINVIVNIIITRYYKRKISSMPKGIFLYTMFILSWLPINVASIFSKEGKWEEIKHTRSMSIEDITKEDIIA